MGLFPGGRFIFEGVLAFENWGALFEGALILGILGKSVHM